MAVYVVSLPAYLALAEQPIKEIQRQGIEFPHPLLIVSDGLLLVSVQERSVCQGLAYRLASLSAM